MTDFYETEKLYRAILPYAPFIKDDGSISSGAFKDAKGLSVDRQMKRENNEAVDYIKSQKRGIIVSVMVKECYVKGIRCIYVPTYDNPYHSELHKNKEKKLLTSSQAKYLSKICKIEYLNEKIS